MKNFIVDSHCHLDLIEEKGLALEEILNNCQINKVKILQTICTRITDIDRLLNYTKINDNIFCSVGIHPCNVFEQPRIKADDLIKLINLHPKIIGIGETGLDYFHDLTHKILQQEIFLEHIFASQQLQLPTIIHSRDADEDMIKILLAEQKKQHFPALLHCFSSTYQLAKTALDLGIYISIAGIISFKNASDLQEIVKKIPLEFLLVETDSPYLAPMPFRGKINQPSYTLHVVEAIANLKNVSVEEVISQTTANFLKIFQRTKSSE